MNYNHKLYIMNRAMRFHYLVPIMHYTNWWVINCTTETLPILFKSNSSLEVSVKHWLNKIDKIEAAAINFSSNCSKNKIYKYHCPLDDKSLIILVLFVLYFIIQLYRTKKLYVGNFIYKNDFDHSLVTIERSHV